MVFQQRFKHLELCAIHRLAPDFFPFTIKNGLVSLQQSLRVVHEPLDAKHLLHSFIKTRTVSDSCKSRSNFFIRVLRIV